MLNNSSLNCLFASLKSIEGLSLIITTLCVFCIFYLSPLYDYLINLAMIPASLLTA